MKKLVLLVAIAFAGMTSQGMAQYYYSPYYYSPYYYAPQPVFYNADGYLRETLNNLVDAAGALPAPRRPAGLLL